MKKSLYSISILIVIAGIVGASLYSKMMHIRTYKSPDGQYELIVKNGRGIFSATMLGDGGKSMPVEVVLKNVHGKVIGKSSSNSNCGTLLFSIEVTWNLENEQVWYGKAKTIHLKTGRVAC